jgi:hypothetical protein
VQHAAFNGGSWRHEAASNPLRERHDLAIFRAKCGLRAATGIPKKPVQNDPTKGNDREKVW